MKARRLVSLAFKSLWMHKLRSLLTVLGIVFGVSSVVAMLAIGEGASQEAQEQIRQLGSRNLLLASVKPTEGGDAGETRTRVIRYGLLRRDLEGIALTLPDVSRIVPRRDVPSEIRRGGRKVTGRLMGTVADYADVANLRVQSGRFLSAADGHARKAVCVLGETVARRLFHSVDPVGQEIRAGKHYYQVVGLLAMRGEGTGGTAGLGGESDMAVFVPLETMRERYGDIIQNRSSGSFSRENVQLHRITIEAADSDEKTIQRVAASLRAFITARHPKDDVRITVPLELLRQARETERIFTIVLGSIAAISLIVGGIGIMNIMLATVVERTREIGVRRALGARRSHIVRQFLAETILLSIGGGVVGLLLGVAIPLAVTHFAGMHTVVRAEFLILAFGISGLVGIIFGLYPAARAADLDPVEALRRE